VSQQSPSQLNHSGEVASSFQKLLLRHLELINYLKTKTMKKIIPAALLTLAAAPAFFLFAPAARADTVVSCYPITQSKIYQNPADHPGAYRDGYREGRESERRGESYQPRTAGGEFAVGFEDGYFGRRFTGQQYLVPNQVEYYMSQQCNTYSFRDPIPNGFLVRPRFRDRTWIRW
jgi:hypothetical protein